MTTNPIVTAQNPDELFDVVDGNDCVIAQATRAEVHARNLFHRAVHILVRDGNGNIILQRRSLAKDTCPGLFSTSCAGHVDAGETYGTAAIRELGEELGIPREAAKAIQFLFSMPPQEKLGWEFIHVYLLDYPGKLIPNPAEIDALISLSPDALAEKIMRDARSFADSFLLVFDELKKMKISDI